MTSDLSDLTEERFCACGCGMTFRCKVTSQRRYVSYGHCTGGLRPGTRVGSATGRGGVFDYQQIRDLYIPEPETPFGDVHSPIIYD